MKNKKRLYAGLALALAGALLFANLSWAQAQGSGACCAAKAPAGGVCTVAPGQGTVCTVTPPPNCPHVKQQGVQGQGSEGQKAPEPAAGQPKADK
jgi:hypothetical protein